MQANDHIASAIHYLRRSEVDITRWDDCVAKSSSPLIYGYSYYLDGMTGGQWDGLVWEDYRAVMPLTWRSKAGVRYCFQPAFTQQTGIFCRRASGLAGPATSSAERAPAGPATSSAEPAPAGPARVDPLLVEAFLRRLDRHFRFAEICLNYANALPSLGRRVNYTLPLDRSYPQLAAAYKKDLARNLKAADRSTPQYVNDFDLHTALADFREQYASRLPAITSGDYRRFQGLCERLRTQGQLVTRAVLDSRGHELCSAIFLKDATRFYLLHSTTLPAGRDTEANHFLIDSFIREWANSPMVLDFEGSDHPGIAHFYANFGATDQPYFIYRCNRLPWPLRWLK